MAGDASEVFAQETFRYRDQEYTLTPTTFITRGLFVTWIEADNISHVRRHKADYGDDYLAVLGQQGRISWGSQEWAAALGRDETLQELAYLVLKQSHQDVTRKLIADLWELPGGQLVDAKTKKESAGTLGAELWQKIWRLINRPNSPRPGAEPGAA